MVALGDPGRARERTLESGAASASFNAWKTGRGAGGADALAVRDWIAAVLRQTLEDWQGRSAPLALVNYYGLREYGAGAMMVNHRDDARVWWGGVGVVPSRKVSRGPAEPRPRLSTLSAPPTPRRRATREGPHLRRRRQRRAGRRRGLAAVHRGRRRLRQAVRRA